MVDSGVSSLEGEVRVAPLSNIEPLLRSMGYDPEPIFGAAGLDASDFLDLDHRIPYSKAARLLGQCTKSTGYDHFGLLAGQFFLITNLGIPGVLAYTAPTVNAALHDIVEHMGFHDQGGVATFNTTSRYTAFGYAIATAGTEATDQVYDLCTSIICGIMRSFCGSDWNPTRVELARRLPKDSQPYKDYFRAPVIFDSTRSAVVFSNKWLTHPLETADDNYHSHIAAEARPLRQSMPNSVSLQVRIALHSKLTNATCDAAAMADLLGLHERTLHRRLQAEGTSFRQLLEETRRISGCNYLSSTSLPISSIATALGYGSTGAFDHAFKRWYSKSPKQWRESGVTETLL